MNFTFYQLLIRGHNVFLAPYIIIYPDMIELNRFV